MGSSILSCDSQQGAPEQRRDRASQLQVIAFSATIPNARELAGWLNDAVLFESSERPTPLVRKILCGGQRLGLDEARVHLRALKQGAAAAKGSGGGKKMKKQPPQSSPARSNKEEDFNLVRAQLAPPHASGTAPRRKTAAPVFAGTKKRCGPRQANDGGSQAAEGGAERHRSEKVAIAIAIAAAAAAVLGSSRGIATEAEALKRKREALCSKIDQLDLSSHELTHGKNELQKNLKNSSHTSSTTFRLPHQIKSLLEAAMCDGTLDH